MPRAPTYAPWSAITKSSDGLVRVDRGLCIGCRACSDACPYGVPQYGADGLMQKCDLCAAAGTRPGGDGCPPCVATCPTGALTLVRLTIDEKLQTERDVLNSLQ
jgi:anaerobic dimethyl sulfoxide reductase subunit B (iron-sulfur subunit)